jgi:hypothetical protein
LIICGVYFLVRHLKDRQAKKYIQQHPESATIYMLVENGGEAVFGMHPRTVDGKKSAYETYAEGYGVYVSPGQHTLEIKLSRQAPGSAKYEPQGVLSVAVLVEAGKPYLLKLDPSATGVYLEEGYPPRSPYLSE